MARWCWLDGDAGAFSLGPGAGVGAARSWLGRQLGLIMLYPVRMGLLVGIGVVALAWVYGWFVRKCEEELHLAQHPRQKPSDDPRWLPGHGF